MKKCKKVVALGLCVAFAVTPLAGNVSSWWLPVQQVYAADQQVNVSDLVVKFLGVPEYEPNRYTKKDGGKWAPEELEKGLKIKASMKLGEGNPEGMMAPLKFSLADITASETFDVASGNITIVYNGLTLTMQAGQNTAILNDGNSTKTLTMNNAVVPYFEKEDEEKNPDGSQYYTCYLPVKFTAEALGGSVVWNEQMHRMEMAFAFYYSDAAIAPVVNSKSFYTTQKIESGQTYNYANLKKQITVAGSLDATAVNSNVADMMKAAMNVVDPKYQNSDGGWGKTNTEYDLLNDRFTELCNHAYSTFDNGSTHGHLRLLATIIRLSKENPTLFAGYTTQLSTIEQGFWKAVKYVMSAQNSMGGWPQYYPYGVGYFKNITFNDNAMPDVMDVVFAMTNDTGLIDSTNCDNFAWARAELAANSSIPTSEGITAADLKSCWDKAIAFTLNAQVKVDGTLTGWAQQYDNKTGAPAGGRAFELPSISPNESYTVVQVLANIKNPSAEVKTAINSYVTWINSVGFTGYSYYTITDRTRELAKDKLLVKDGSTTKLFGRFYGLDTTGACYGLNVANKLTSSKYYEIFAGRDGIARFNMNDGMSERRSNYQFASGPDTNGKNAEDKANDLLLSWQTALKK